MGSSAVASVLPFPTGGMEPVGRTSSAGFLRKQSPFEVPREPARKLGALAARSRPMQDVFSVVERLAATGVTVTILGETGTGKEVFAHALHDLSPRASGPFVVFDCGAIPANLIESELFGHERGAFTGAHAEHVGAFERARGGTLLLDEIGELPLELQPRLLRVLDHHSVRRVGGTRDHRLDVRVVAATNRDSAALVTSRHFRQDLYFRLVAALVQLPPLRNRLDDLPLLVQQLLKDLGRPEVPFDGGRVRGAARAHVAGQRPRAEEHARVCPGLRRHRQRQRLERRRAGCPPPALRDADDRRARARPPAARGHSLEQLERAAIAQTLSSTRGNKVQAARVLGIAPSTLYEKLKRYGITS